MDVLDETAKSDPRDIIALLLWKDRYRNPEMAVQITEADIQAFRACTEYLEVRPKVRIERPQGLPAQEALPAAGKRRAVPAREATPPKPYVIVQVVDANGDAIRPVESTEEGAKTRDEADRLRRHRDAIPALAAQVIADARAGNFSSSMVVELAEAAKALARV